MLNWLKKLLAGDQSAVPEGAQVERDAQGRVVQVNQTLGAAPAKDEAPKHPKLTIAEAAKPTLGQAADWLRAQNILAAQTLGLGLEQRFDFSQDDGLLRLSFADGRELALPAQLLGSFVPREGFMWGWHNPSVQPQLKLAAQAAREAGRALDAAAFDTPELDVRFEDLTLLLAFAAQTTGHAGVYRAILGDHTSVFLAFTIPEQTQTLPAPDADFVARARERALAYDREMLAHDVHYREHADKSQGQKTDSALLDQVLAAKLETWQRHWVRDDEYWRPTSVGWPSDHDRTGGAVEFLAPHPAGGMLDVHTDSLGRETVYYLQAIDGEAKIVDQLLDWGEGFIWPRLD